MAAGSTYTPIATTTLGSNQASYTFNSIPNTYTDLILVVNGQVSSNVSLACQINGDTASNYNVTEFFGDGTTASAFRQSNNAQITVASIGAQINSGSQWVSIIQFVNYSNTTSHKTVLGRTSATATGVNGIAGLYRSNSAISSLKFMGYAGSSGFTTGTTFTLYGITAA